MIRPDHDQAEVDQLRLAVTSQGAIIGQHGAALQELSRGVHEITTMLSQLRSRSEVSSSVTTSSASLPVQMGAPLGEARGGREPWVSPPDHYDGVLGSGRYFLLQCEILFSSQPRMYATEQSRVAVVMSLLRGKALAWATPLWESQSSVTASYTAFATELRRVFDHSVRSQDASRRMLVLRQGEESVAEYALAFRTLAAECRWNEEALISVFAQGLCSRIQDELVSYPETEGLEELMALALRIDNRVRERGRQRNRANNRERIRRIDSTEYRFPGVESDGEPMQLGRLRVSREEHRRRMRENRCVGCGLRGHYHKDCPRRCLNEQPRQ